MSPPPHTPKSLNKYCNPEGLVCRLVCLGKNLERRRLSDSCYSQNQKCVKRSDEVTDTESSKIPWSSFLEPGVSIPSPIQICTHWTKWLNHTARKTEPGTGSSDCRRPLPSVTEPRASNWNHIVLLLRHHSAVQIHKPIINPRDVPTLRSFPSCSDTHTLRPPSAAQSDSFSLAGRKT